MSFALIIPLVHSPLFPLFFSLNFIGPCKYTLFNSTRDPSVFFFVSMGEPLALLIEAKRGLGRPLEFLLKSSDDDTLQLIPEASYLASGAPSTPEYVVFDASLVFPSGTLLPLKSSRTSTNYTLFSLYFYLTRTLQLADEDKTDAKGTYKRYLAECKERAIDSVSFIDTKVISQLMAGETVSGLEDSLLLYTKPLTLKDLLGHEEDVQGKRRAETGPQSFMANKQTKLGSGIESTTELRTPQTLAQLTEKPLYKKDAIFKMSLDVPLKGVSDLVKSLKDVLRDVAVASSSATLMTSTVLDKRPSVVVSDVKKPLAPPQRPSSSAVGSTLLPSSVSVNIQDPRSLLHQLSATDHPTAMNAAQKAPLPRPKGHSTQPSSKLPIIIVPASASALISLFNVKRFLEETKFESQEEARRHACNVKESFLTIKRPAMAMHASSTDLLSHTFLVIDSIAKLRSQDW